MLQERVLRRPPTPTDLKDNYALWANKGRILSLEIPEGYITAGDLVDITIKANADTKAMFHGPAPENHDARLAYDYYYLLTDWDSRNAVGVAPLKEMIDAVDAVESLEDKERISELVDEIIAAYHGIIAEADFISDETRAGAYAKMQQGVRPPRVA